jgi:KipI family sensor histidine kinase inhibitor
LIGLDERELSSYCLGSECFAKGKVRPVKKWPRYRPCGDKALSVELGEAINVDINRRVHRLHGQLRSRPVAGLLGMNPTYRALFIEYDPRLLSFERLILLVEEAIQTPMPSGEERETVDIPVCYGGEFGPDLEEVAALHNLSSTEVIGLHSASLYHVYMIGFTPGFPYLGGLDPRLATPRKKTPRERVPGGSVGIADQQSGIYPIESPGGWQIIGRTPLKLFDLNRSPVFLIRAGQAVRFRAIARDEFEGYAD